MRATFSSIGFLLILLASTCVPRVSPMTALADDSGPKELEAFQGYLDPAPIGMDVRFAWTLEGGRGENVRIVDIEYDWNLQHSDLTAALSNLLVYVQGTDPLPQFNVDHGTAVLGELIAADDGVGVTGIANKSRVGLINPVTGGNTQDVAGAIRKAASVLTPGDVILLEQQSIQGPRFDAATGRGLVPIEFEPDVFNAIRDATSAGIVVVESAGNGFDDLDLSVYNGAFDRIRRDSGAILVGAGLPEGGVYGPGPDRTRTTESNFGSRVDVQGWGRFITTCGYGDLRHDQGPDHWYTIDFGATSGATAMVAGACAVLESIVIARGRTPLSPSALRTILVSTGSPQQGNSAEHIGPRPDLRAAIAALDAPAADNPVIEHARLKSGTKLVLDGQHFLVGDAIMEIDGTPVTRIKYPEEFRLPNGQTTRIVSKSDVTGLMPRGQQVMITVFNPSTGKRSDPFPFTRQ